MSVRACKKEDKGLQNLEVLKTGPASGRSPQLVTYLHLSITFAYAEMSCFGQIGSIGQASEQSIGNVGNELFVGFGGLIKSSCEFSPV